VDFGDIFWMLVRDAYVKSDRRCWWLTDNFNMNSLFSESAFQTFGQKFRPKIQKVPKISTRKKYKNNSNIDYLSSFRSNVRLNVMLIIEQNGGKIKILFCRQPVALANQKFLYFRKPTRKLWINKTLKRWKSRPGETLLSYIEKSTALMILVTGSWCHSRTVDKSSSLYYSIRISDQMTIEHLAEILAAQKSVPWISDDVFRFFGTIQVTNYKLRWGVV